MPNPVTYILRDFGATAAQPAVILTKSNTLQLFIQPSAVPAARNAGVVIPPTWSTPGTPQNFNYQGRVQMPGQLLVAPGTGSLNGKYYTIVAAGVVDIPNTAEASSFNLVMNQNYFAYGRSVISDVLFTFPNSVLAVPGSVTNWTLSATLAGNGIGTPPLSCAGIAQVNGVQLVGNGFSVNPIRNQEPIIQLSFGVKFTGVSSIDPYTAYLTKFQITQTTQ